MTRIIGIIPARMGSSRFPGKPLAPILGLPMIEHVYRRASICQQLDGVIVATCDQIIQSTVDAFGGTAIMTSAEHERATDRTAEAAEHLDADIIVMVQGDEPMITPGMIEVSLTPLLQDSSVSCVNLARQIKTEEEYRDTNTIKVLTDSEGNALSFSRVGMSEFKDAKILKQVCVIPFRIELLRKFADLPPTPLEKEESIDMLRLIEHGQKVRIVETEVDTHSVDTPEDLRLVESLMRSDALLRRY